jgi:hypothetical protein
VHPTTRRHQLLERHSADGASVSSVAAGVSQARQHGTGAFRWRYAVATKRFARRAAGRSAVADLRSTRPLEAICRGLEAVEPAIGVAKSWWPVAALAYASVPIRA